MELVQYRTITSADRQKEIEGGREDSGVKPLVYPGGGGETWLQAVQ